MTKSGFDIEEGALTDLIADAISGSMDYDWTARDGARSTYAALVPILTEIRELRAENARLREDLADTKAEYHRVSEAFLVHARAALGEPQ